ncbi:zinc finger protein 512B isoform X2 [Bombina bombina]|nr:zinc finger protein 512B isoform X2 [Bombina bombina]
MADSPCPGSRRRFPRTNTAPLCHPESRTCPINNPPNSASSNKVAVLRRHAKGDNRELREIPTSLLKQWKEKFKTLSRVMCPCSGCWLEFPNVYGLKYHYQRCQGAALSSRLLFSCPSCDATFASKSQMEKHLVWNHSNGGKSRERNSSYPTSSCDGHKRVAESPPSSKKHPKQAKLGKPTENGECPPNKLNIKHRELCLSDEDPERMRHRRKQKTPKKFTGEQPSITGTFGLKGLGKAEDRSRGRRVRIIVGRIEKAKKRSTSTLFSRKVHTTASLGSVEDRFHHQISKKGEAVCPNCASVTRKTMAGLRKHMEVCEQLQEALRCKHCRKQFKSKAGLNYHTMAEHVNKLPSLMEAPLDEQKERERLRRVLKQMGKLRCPREDCSASFTSLMGYQYHTQRCGKQPCEAKNLHFTCPHCSKEYQSKAGRDYHVRSEHSVGPKESPPEIQEVEPEEFERTPSGRVRRQSAQVAVFHLQEIAEDELVKEGGKRKMKADLVPDSKRLNYLRPGLPTFNPQLLDIWKTHVRENGFICCPNNCCEAIYSSVSGLKAHLANCNKGNHSVGKYRCLLCKKEFSSESGVKYHIMKTHSQNWFRVALGPSSPKRKIPQNNPREESKTGATGKKRGRKPKERPPAATITPATPLVKEPPPDLKTYSKTTALEGVQTISPEPKGTARKTTLSRRAK